MNVNNPEDKIIDNDSFWTRYARPSIVVRFLLIVLVFLQFYPTKLIFLPVTLRVVVSAMGVGLMFVKYIITAISGKKLFIDKRFLQILLPLCIMTILSAISLNFNGTSDTMYLYYFTTSFLMLSSGYFTINVMHWVYKEKLSFEIIAYYCILAVFCQLIFGLISYLDKPLVLPLLMKTEEGLLQLDSTDTGRFVGLGQYFMNLGVANGFGLLMIGILLKNAVNFGITKGTKFILTFEFLFIAVLGNMQARTTTICALIVVAYLIFSTLKLNFESLKAGLGQIILSLFLLVGLLGFIVYYWGDQLSKYNDAIYYGFELFMSAENGKVSTHSSDLLKWMLTIWPTTDKTWIIGDGQYFVNGGGYYMRTDVGYARLLFYFGTFGMLTFFIYQIIVTGIAFKRIIPKGWQAIWIYIFVTILIINIKSCVDYTFYISLFFSYNILFNKNYYKKNDIVDSLEPIEVTNDSKLMPSI